MPSDENVLVGITTHEPEDARLAHITAEAGLPEFDEYTSCGALVFDF